MRSSPDETRKVNEELTKRALAEIVRERIFERRLHQSVMASVSRLSRSHLRAILRAEKSVSLFLFLELSRGLRIDDPCELLRRVLDRRGALRESPPP
jgi:transcriptional regulator with XRE-family HTH domain